MKFLCDRCKTRYSIGDERVRGKILKIRCKNCANVITVREGMSDVDAPAAPADAYKRPKMQTEAAGIDQVVATTAAPTASANGRNGSSGALNAAFANAMTKPPPALEEEWYVSIEGDQSGPFTLAEAQRWVAGKAFDAELHCWSEGFDDWLPVDKVSHFRGLRKKPPQAAAPPPLPRGGSGPVRQQRQSARGVEAVEDEPKPLFAATMASLENAAPAQPPPRGLSLPSVTRPSATPPSGQPAYKNGNGAKEKSAPIAAKGTGTATSTTGPIRPTTKPGVGAKPYGFDAADSATQLEALPFEDEQRTTAEPVAAAARKLAPATSTPSTAVTANHNAFPAGQKAFADALKSGAPTTPTPAFKPVHPPAPPPPDANDDIDIGEVSRVVKLADLMKPQPKPAAKRSGQIATGASNPLLGRTGSVPKLPVAVPLAQAVDAPPSLDGSAPIGVPSEVPEAIAPAVAVHRRGTMALLIGATALIGIAIVLIVLVVNKNDDVTSLGGEYDLDTQRPDHVVRRPGDPPITGPENPFLPPKKPWVPQRPPDRPVRPPDQPPPGNSLKADEIESMAAKYSGTTTSCWRRAQRGANGILLADVKKITVTMSIAPDGTVTNVALSDGHAGNDLGKCLIGAMRGWKFRTSAGGDFRFVLHFG